MSSCSTSCQSKNCELTSKLQDRDMLIGKLSKIPSDGPQLPPLDTDKYEESSKNVMKVKGLTDMKGQEVDVGAGNISHWVQPLVASIDPAP